MNVTWKYTLPFMASICLALFTACKQDTPRASTNLEVADIKGIRFDEPVPAANTPATEVSSGESADINKPASLPTAADVPDNIALIPSATPVPPEPTAASTPAVTAPSTVASETTARGDYEEVSFKVLSGFKYVEPIPQEGEKPEDVEKRRISDQIPPDIKALDGKRAVVQGWMVPMEITDDGAVKSFVLVNIQPECCFGDMQAMNEWIDVVMQPGKSAEFNVDQPVKVYGKLEVGEKMEDGFVLSVYRMTGDRVEL